ncbi:MAG: rod shape-determining protein MreD [Thermoflavifilum sp.]|nr:rod shape-determining protein MreD [Thermoflavifilum sp.]
MSELLKNIIRFVLLMFVQVFILNNIMLNGLVQPYLYMLFILLLPFQTPRWLLLIIGTATGWVLDNFMHTPGLHAAACAAVAYLRPFLIGMLSPQGGFEDTSRSPSPATMGTTKFIFYAGMLVLIHHVIYFTLEVFDFQAPRYLAMKILFSTLITLLLIFVYGLLFFEKRLKRRSFS